ncbi:MAG: pyruvate dehydrogenase, component alpha subunit [Chlamydiota bacterium]|jgi:pyruvate dehydrogenase E1 component alpha subunit
MTKQPRLFSCDRKKVASELGKNLLIKALRECLAIRNFEIRGEVAYSQGNVGGFYHSYMGQEAIQVGCIAAAGSNHWYTTTYRCHALALLLGVTPNEAMAELYGRSTGIAQGRGGSMHMYTDRMLGGLAIVGGHIPIATGAAFSIKYQGQKDLVSFCFLGDGAVVQGAFHEALNLASLWSLPCIYVIENNQWGMGTAVERAVCVSPIAEHFAQSYNIESYTVDGMDFLSCYACFKEVVAKTTHSARPVLIEALSERFRGHSISDPGLYRSKDTLKQTMERDPILILKNDLIAQGWIDEETFLAYDKEAKETMLAAMRFAEESPWPDPMMLEDGVYAPGET